MNKLLIPSVLASVMLFAGVFAFIPVNDASTVHSTIQENGLKIIRETFTISDGADDLYDGTLTISLDEGTATSAPYTIQAIFFCDVEVGDNAAAQLEYSFDVEGFSGELTTGVGAESLDDLINENAGENECTDILSQLSNAYVGGAGQSTDVPVVIDLDEEDPDPDDDEDGATVVVYAQVRGDVSDTALVLTSTTDDS